MMSNDYVGEGPGVQQQGASPPSSEQPLAPKRRRKGLAIGLSLGGLVAVVTVVLIALSMTVWAKPDRQDYELAASFTDTSMGFFVLIVASTESAWLATSGGEPMEAEIAEAHASAADFDEHMEGLSELTAVTGDPEIGALFEEVDRAYGSGRDHLLTVLEVMPPMSEYFRACHGNSTNPISDMRLGMPETDLDRVLADYDQSQVACTEALEAMADGEHEWPREYAETQLELWPPLREATEQIGRAAVADDRAAIQQATETMTAASDALRNAQAAFENDFRNLTRERPSSESSDALLAALEEKIQES